MMGYMLARELAARCRVDRRTVYNWASRGVVPGAHKLGGVWRFDVSKVTAWIRKREQAPCPSIVGAKSGGSASKPKALRSDNRLEQLLNLPH
ncbi:MAG: helix-turn-helix transcriptional regulator [Geminicoccaceae bacterium]